MTSNNLMEFEKAIKYMDPMQVTDYLQKTLDFLRRNNSEVYFPSISPYVEAFLVNLVSDTRNLESKCFNCEDRVLATEIIGVLEMSREVFRWTHAYENGSLLVYKKIFSNKIKRKPIKLSSIADRMIQPQASDLRRPHKHRPSTPLRAPNLPSTQDPKNGIFTTSFKLKFLDTTLCFVKSHAETKLTYPEMPISQAEYIYNLIKYRDKDVGFGYKSLYAQLWEAMEGYGVDYEFEVTLEETVGKEKAVLVLEKVTKNTNKAKKVKAVTKTKRSINENNKEVTEKAKELAESPCKENQDCNRQRNPLLDSCFLDPYYADAASKIPSFGVLTNITEKFFTKTLAALTDFADNENCKLKTFDQLSDDELKFVKEVQGFSESNTARDMFMPKYRILLWKFDRMVTKLRKNFDLSVTVDEEDRSITWKKTSKSAGAVPKPSDNSSALPPLELLANISEPFFKQTIAALTEFADDESCASRTFTKITKDEIVFVRRVRELAGSSKVRELFDPHYRDLLRRLNFSIIEASFTCKITTTVNEKEGSITLNKKPKFATPAPVPPVVKRKTAAGARSISMVAMKTRDRSISKDRLIQFEKGGKLPVTDATPPAEERGRSVSKRAAKLLEDLATPVESDVGMRMMLRMGWDGGALGARGEGIMEPVMPKIDLPTRGGLGHVPPPKVVPQKPIDFRLALLHNLLDFLLHDDLNKQIHFKAPIVEKERKFIKHILTSVNGRHNIGLTPIENDITAKIYGRLADYPSMEIRGEVSKDLRSMTLLKLLDRPLRGINIKIPKPSTSVATPKPPPASNKDMTITRADVSRALSHIDITQMDVPASSQAIKKRALRLLFLTKFVEAMSGDWGKKIVFKYVEGGIPKPVVTFLKTAIVHLNNNDRCLNLCGEEVRVYGDLLRLSRGSLLELEFRAASQITITRKLIVKEESLPKNFAELKVSDNNTTKTDKCHQTENNNDSIKSIISSTLETDNSVVNLIDTVSVKSKTNIIDNVKNNNAKDDGRDKRNILIEAIEKTSLRSTDNTDIDMDVNNNKDECLTQKNNENDVERKANIDINCVGSETTNHCKINENITNDNLKDMNPETEVDYQFLVKTTKTHEELEFKIEPRDITLNNDKKHDVSRNIEEIKMEDTDFVPDNRNIAGLSDLDKDEQNLEMAILNSELEVSSCVKIENKSDDCASNIEVENSDIDPIFNINDDSNICGKRSHSNSICSQDMDPKKTKLITENDDNVVIIVPKNPNAKIKRDTVKEVQTIMAKELNKSGAFLPLLKCHGEQNGGLVYSCHDDDDVAWLNKVISDANLDLEIVIKEDLSVENKSKELLIKINSYIHLDTKETFRKFEIYNVGLDTKLWKVLLKHENDTFVIFIVTVDDKSFKYISDENFSLYCGLDKAQFSIIFK